SKGRVLFFILLADIMSNTACACSTRISLIICLLLPLFHFLIVQRGKAHRLGGGFFPLTGAAVSWNFGFFSVCFRKILL
ncbi:MAG: hypothetical protein WCP10_11945, partial [Desulfuromonadales bacterium]